MQLAGVVAVQVTGGPDVPFHAGRKVCKVPFLLYSCILIFVFNLIDHVKKILTIFSLFVSNVRNLLQSFSMAYYIFKDCIFSYNN